MSPKNITIYMYDSVQDNNISEENKRSITVGLMNQKAEFK